MFKIKKEIAKDFIEEQQNGDLCALENLKASLEKDGFNYEIIQYVESLIHLNRVIISMELGDFDYDSHIDELYRTGIRILLNQCNWNLMFDK